jgi:hypothetical protein
MILICNKFVLCIMYSLYVKCISYSYEYVDLFLYNWNTSLMYDAFYILLSYLYGSVGIWNKLQLQLHWGCCHSVHFHSDHNIYKWSYETVIHPATLLHYLRETKDKNWKWWK